ncbi:hypothetical protein BLA29_014177, partial [Euroglyphus maynei]
MEGNKTNRKEEKDKMKKKDKNKKKDKESTKNKSTIDDVVTNGDQPPSAQMMATATSGPTTAISIASNARISLVKM